MITFKPYAMVPYDIITSKSFGKETFEEVYSMIKSFNEESQIRFVIVKKNKDSTEAKICSVYPFTKELPVFDENLEKNFVHLIKSYEDAWGHQEKMKVALNNLLSASDILFK